MTGFAIEAIDAYVDLNFGEKWRRFLRSRLITHPVIAIVSTCMLGTRNFLRGTRHIRWQSGSMVLEMGGPSLEGIYDILWMKSGRLDAISLARSFIERHLEMALCRQDVPGDLRVELRMKLYPGDQIDEYRLHPVFE